MQVAFESDQTCWQTFLFVAVNEKFEKKQLCSPTKIFGAEAANN